MHRVRLGQMGSNRLPLKRNGYHRLCRREVLRKCVRGGASRRLAHLVAVHHHAACAVRVALAVEDAPRRKDVFRPFRDDRAVGDLVPGRHLPVVFAPAARFGVMKLRCPVTSGCPLRCPQYAMKNIPLATFLMSFMTPSTISIFQRGLDVPPVP